MQGFSPRAEHGGPVPPTPSECWTFAQMWPISVRQKIGVEHQPRWVRMCGEVHAQLAGREGKSPRAYRQLGKASLRKPANLCNSLRGHRKGALWHKLASKLGCTHPDLLGKKTITTVHLQKNHNSTEELRAKIEHKVRFAVQ